MHLTTRTTALALAALGVAAPAAAAPAAPEGTPPPPGTTADDGVDAYVVRYDVTETTLDGTVVDHDAGSFEVSADQLEDGVHLTSDDVGEAPASTAAAGAPSPLDEGCRRISIGYTSATDYPWGRQVYWTYEQAKHFCWHHSAGFVDQVWANQYVYDLDPFFFPRENAETEDYVAAWGPSYPKSGHHSRTQWRIENCVPVYGCVSSRSPWAWITVFADGNWAADAGI